MLALFLLPLRVAQASPTNTQGLVLNPFATGFGVKAQANLAMSRGNVELLDSNASLSLLYQSFFSEQGDRPPFLSRRYVLTGSARYATNFQERVATRLSGQARWTRMWIPRLGTEAFAQLHHNEFQRLKLRSIIGAGLRVDFLQQHNILGWAGTGYFFEYNRLMRVPNVDEPLALHEHRWSSYLALRTSLVEDQLLAQLSTFVQPRFDKLSDLRVLTGFELSARLSEHVGWGVDYLLLYDSAPPGGIKRNDHRLSASLKLQW